MPPEVQGGHLLARGQQAPAGHRSNGFPRLPASGATMIPHPTEEVANGIDRARADHNEGTIH